MSSNLSYVFFPIPDNGLEDPRILWIYVYIQQ